MSNNKYEFKKGDEVWIKGKIVAGKSDKWEVELPELGCQHSSNKYLTPTSALQEVPEFQKGDTVEVSGRPEYDDGWRKRIYLFTHKGCYYCGGGGPIANVGSYNNALERLDVYRWNNMRKLPKKEDRYDLTLTRNGEKVDLNILSDFSILALKNGKMGERKGS